MYPKATYDIEVYEEYGEGFLAQCKFLVHGYDDVLWTNDIQAALDYLKDSVELCSKV